MARNRWWIPAITLILMLAGVALFGPPKILRKNQPTAQQMKGASNKADNIRYVYKWELDLATSKISNILKEQGLLKTQTWKQADRVRDLEEKVKLLEERIGRLESPKPRTHPLAAAQN